MIRNRLLFLLFLPVIFVCAVQTAQACSCGPTPTVLESFERVDEVVIVRAVSVEKAGADEQSAVDGVKATKMVVEKVYKGNLKPGAEIRFGQGGGADCIWTFNEKSIGERYLFYLGKPNSEAALWYGGGCGRSTRVDNAADDLLYLENLAKVRGKTRISGKFECWDQDGCPAVDGKKIKIIGADKKVYEVKTDRNGVYEIYGLPAGRYSVEPELPFGWKINNFYLQYSKSFIGDADLPRETRLKKFPIILEDKKHAALNFHLEIDNAIRGKVFDPNGSPMSGVCVRAVSTEKPKGEYQGEFDCTEDDGSFRLEELSPGNYILVLNDDGKLSSTEPFGTLFYPGVSEFEKAGVVAIEAGKFLSDINIQIPFVEEFITVEGRFLYSDGKPVAERGVIFKPVGSNGKNLDEISTATDTEGRFFIRIFKGLTGELFGKTWVYDWDFENCPETAKSLGLTEATRWKDVRTAGLEIDTGKNLTGVELKLPFAPCRKTKSDSK